jgi:hypothetical protein
MKKAIVGLFLLLLLIPCYLLAAGASINSGMITSTGQVVPAGQSGMATAVTCEPDGTNACTCTPYDGADTTGKRIRGAFQDAGSIVEQGWNTAAGPQFLNGIYLVVGANSKCFVEWQR